MKVFRAGLSIIDFVAKEKDFKNLLQKKDLVINGSSLKIVKRPTTRTLTIFYNKTFCVRLIII